MQTAKTVEYLLRHARSHVRNCDKVQTGNGPEISNHVSIML